MSLPTSASQIAGTQQQNSPQTIVVTAEDGLFTVEFCMDDLYGDGTSNRHRMIRSDRGLDFAGGTRWHCNHLLLFEPKTSSIMIKEQMLLSADGRPVGAIGKLSLSMLDFHAPVIEEEFPSKTTLVIHLQLKDGRHIGMADFSDSTGKGKKWLTELLTLRRIDEGDHLRHMKFVRIRFFDYQKNASLHDFVTISKILGGHFHESISDLAYRFVQDQNAAMNAENEARRAKMVDLFRDGCTVDTFRLSQYPEHLCLRITSTMPHDKWLLENNHKLILTDERFFQGTAPASDADGLDAWNATVVDLLPNGAIAIINNLIRDISPLLGIRTVNVKCRIIDIDFLEERMSLAIERSLDCFRAERNELSIEELLDKPWAQLHVPMSRLFIRHAQNDDSAWSDNPVVLRNNNLFDRETFVFPDALGLEESHKKFFQDALSGRGGITGAQGPPGSGKSTLLAKLAMYIPEAALLPESKIVLTAHSNQATKVLLEKLHLLQSTFNCDLTKKMVLIQTPGAAHRMAASEEPLKPELQCYTLGAQMSRIARENPDKMHAYNELHARYSRGDTLTDLEKWRYGLARQFAMQVIRDDFVFFVCTMSTCNTKFFQKRLAESGGSPFLCDILIVDESSQAPMPAFLELWEVLNPIRIVIAGDQKQLSCYSATEEARQIWNMNPMWYTAQLGAKFCTLLDIQYRMSAELFHPTNMLHYRGLVQTSPLAGGAEMERFLLEEVLPFVEIDPMGNNIWRKLNSCAIIFDIDQTEQEQYGKTSWANSLEARVIKRFVECLNVSRLDSSNIMILTGYDGQFKQFYTMREELGASTMAIRKIDSSQGDESPIVILSATRTLGRGFMRNWNRHNVGTSRMSSAFFFFGAMSNCFRNERVWAEWEEYFRGSNAPGEHYIQVTKDCNFRLADAGRAEPELTQPALSTTLGLSHSSAVAALPTSDFDMMEVTPIDTPIDDVRGSSAAGTGSSVLLNPADNAHLPGPYPLKGSKTIFSSLKHQVKFRQLQQIVRSWPVAKQFAAVEYRRAAKYGFRAMRQVKEKWQNILTEEDIDLLQTQLDTLIDPEIAALSPY